MTERFLLDSDICIYLLKNLSPELAARVRLQEEDTLFLSSISLAEVGLGVRSRPEQNGAFARFVEEVSVLPFDTAAARAYATIPFRRARFDRLIAAHALALDLTLVTNNEADFADIANLRLENWTL